MDQELVMQQKQLTKEYQQALRQGRLSLVPASEGRIISSTHDWNHIYHSVHNLPHKLSNGMAWPTPSGCQAPPTLTSKRRPNNAELLAESQPLSAQLKPHTTTDEQVGRNPADAWLLGSIAAATGPGMQAEAAARAAGKQHHHIKLAGRPSSPPRPRSCSPGPGSYSPQTDRRGKLVLSPQACGTFPAAGRYEGSYIEAFAKTIHSPGPIYYPEYGTASSCSNDGCALAVGTMANNSSNGSHITLRATHSMSGSWTRADVGSREMLHVHTCKCTSPCSHSKATTATNSSSSSSSKAGAADGRCHCNSSSADDSCNSSSKGCPGCATGWSIPGPGSYDCAVGRDGRGVLLTQSCPAFTVPKANKLLSGRRSPFVSSQHACHENQGSDSPGPVYQPDISLTRPSSCSPTMNARGLNHWDVVYNSLRATTAKQLLGPNAISRDSRRLLGDGPRTHFGTTPLDARHWPLIYRHHSPMQ